MNFSPLMLGTVQFGQPYGIANRTGQPSYRTVCDILTTAAAAGINCLDTAAVYGTSEEAIGQALAELNLRDRLQVVTKIMPVNNDPGLIRVSVEQSLRRLQLETLPVVLFHRETDFAHLDALEKLRQAGLVGRIGVSCDNRPGPALQMLATGRVAALQLPGNVLDRRHQRTGIFAAAAARGVPVFIRSVYLQGLLLMPAESVPANLRAILPVRERLAKLASEAGLSLAELALRYMLGQPGVTSVITGIESVEQLRANIAMIARGPLPADLDVAVPELPEAILSPGLWK